MKRLLIANRGEIAVRIARTARDLGIETVGVHAAEDAALAEGYGVSKVVALDGRGAAAYLDVAQIVALARAHACDALHPGYGFASESASLARACESAGIVFVGPAAESLERFGDKSTARALAREAGVPIVPGIDAPASIDDVRRFFEARPDGGAIVLKAAAGGGGRGMRMVSELDALANAFARCQSEAERSFGSDALFAEHRVEGARHIEVQVVADARGGVGHLWERDCTLQRRHQKLIEIAPAPALDAGTRSALLEAAQAIARAAHYRGVGTVEFLVDPTGAFFFIEVNPRLQVEHTVTEEVTGIDLVEVQLLLAEGATLDELGLANPPEARGHAIQLRVLAESLDAEGNARPSGESIVTFEPPAGPGIRVDTAMRRGLAAHPAFDSLLAKLVVTSAAASYDRLVRRARRAISEFCIEGPRTNLGLLAALLERPELESYALTTTFIGEQADALARAASDHSLKSALKGAPKNEENVAAREAASREAADVGPTGPVSATAAPHPAANRSVPPGTQAVCAPLLGTVLEVLVRAGDAVSAGQPLCILESMKMEHVINAEQAGVVEAVFAASGDVVAEHDVLAVLAPLTAAAADERHELHEGAADLDTIRPDLAEVHSRHALLYDAARPEAVERRRQRGQRTARENLEGVCDPDSFVEYGALAVAAMRRVRAIEELERKTPGDAILTGFGTINASLFGAERARCALLVVDATVLAGTQGFFHHKKIDRILELAEEHDTPVVFFPEGGGGRPNDTDASDVFVAGLNITSFQNFARLSGKVPRVSIVSGFCFAGSAAFAGCADVIIATRRSSLGMGGPAMIEGGGLGVYAPEDVGPMSVQEANGVVDLLVEDEVEAVEAARRYLSYFQGPTEDWRAADQRALRHLIPENRRRVYDVRRVIDTLCDVDSVLELRRAWGVGMITALVRIEGQPMGLVANDPMHLGGAIDDEGAEKAARFLQLCDAFGLPVLSLCDTPGFMVGPEIEARAQVRKVSRLFVVGASLSVPVFAVILRKGYGLGAQAMAGGSFAAPFYIAAWPTGEIGGMGLEGAVNLGFKKQLAEQETEAERQALFEKLVGVMYEKGKALHAASQLEFDAVIDPAETRTQLRRAMNAAGTTALRASGRFVDTW